MKIKIALIGKTNVGKSTLFNFLTRQRDALVGKQPKLTRDRKYGYHNTNSNIDFIIIDTAGIIIDAKKLDYEISKQSFMAIKEADIIFFIMDGQIGLSHEDIFINNYLRKTGKKIFFVINKTEKINSDIAKSEFYSLGSKKLYTISATNGLGIENLIHKSTSKYFIKYKNIENKNCLNTHKIKITIVGCKNSGKSTLINTFIKKNRLLTDCKPGTTRENINIFCNYQTNKIVLTDTAGIYKNKKKSFIKDLSRKKTFQSINESNIIILVIDSKNFFSENIFFIIKYLLNKGKFFTIAINKCDLLKEEEKIQFKNFLFLRLNFIKFIPIYFVSSIYNEKIDYLFKNSIQHYFKKNKKVSTNRINKIINYAINSYPPPMIMGKRIKLKYGHIGSYDPYTIVIHGNQLNSLSKQYKCYLINFFYRFLKIKGTSIKIFFKTSINPFLNKNNH